MDKFKIIVLEGSASGDVVEAQFNPGEISIDKSVPWQRQARKGPSDLTYMGSEARTMSCELLFDGFSTGTSIQGEVEKLQKLTDIDTTLKRPPKLRVVWGVEGVSGGMPRFDAVIERLVVRYTLFDPSGKPVRAAALVTFKEARSLMVGKTV